MNFLLIMVLGFSKNRIIIDIPKYFLSSLLFSSLSLGFWENFIFVVDIDSEAIIQAIEQFYFVYDKRNNSCSQWPRHGGAKRPFTNIFLGFSLQKYIDFVETGNEWDIDNWVFFSRIFYLFYLREYHFN